MSDAALVEGLEDEQVDITDDRSVLDHRVEALQLEAGVGNLAQGRVLGDVGHVDVVVLEKAQVRGDLGPGGDDRGEVAAHDLAQVVHGEHVGGVGQGDDRHPVVDGDWEHHVVTGHRLGDQADGAGLDSDFVQIDELEPNFLGHRPHQVVLGRQLLVVEIAGE